MYEYLKPFVNNPLSHTTELVNSFYPVTNKSTEEAEKDLGMVFPSELKQFYQEIGYGFLISPCGEPKDYIFSGVNRIIPPSDIVDIIQNEGGEIMMESSYEDLEPGDIPVFEIGDSTRFLVMKPQSDNPNALYFLGLEVVAEDSFERFIYKLYHDDPGYYDDELDEYWDNLKKDQ